MSLDPILTLGILLAYFSLLIGVSYFTSKDSTNADFYLAGKKSPWYIVAFGMIGASLSGVTFISIPGAVGAGGANMAFSYMQMVFGYMVGYLVIATVLMPIYYKMDKVTIYQYLEERFGKVSYKTGAAFFLLSRIVGASFRLYLVALVLHNFVLGPMGISYFLTVAITLGLIYTYTFRGGIKTIIWTDTLQTVCMLVAVVATVVFICGSLDISLTQIPSSIREAGYGQMFFFENGWGDPNNFFKQFLGGALIALVMTGLDQDMMQKNLSCKSLQEAQWNISLFSIVLIFVNLLFLALGALLYIYANKNGLAIPDKTDSLYPMLAFEHFPKGIAIMFILGLIAAAYSSADSALTALTTSFSVDILEVENKAYTVEQKKSYRMWIHLGFSVVLAAVILLFNSYLDSAAINGLFKAATYTYGPILGLFAFGILTDRRVYDKWVWVICIASPVLAYILDIYSVQLFNGFKFGFLSLAINGLLTFLGLMAISKRKLA
jgi:Na+/proline symporter